MHVLVPLAAPQAPQALQPHAMRSDARDSAHSRHTPEGEQPPEAVRPRHVLLAEDDDTSRLVAERLLSQAGYGVACAKDGQQVLEMLREGQYDCVFMDIQMPVLDGIETTRRIRAGLAGDAACNVPVIALTAHAMKGDRERFLHIGMDAYLEKPLSIDLVDAALEEALRNARARVMA
jgi:CheY-like chemotaxis protein